MLTSACGIPAIPPGDHAALPTATILIADDEVEIAQLGKIMLSRYGYQILLAQDGQEAVEIFRDHAEEVSVVILDLTMPKLNGWEAMREISGIKPTTRFIISSGYGDGFPRDDAPQDVQYLHKPFRMSDLVSTVQSLVVS
jgi:CheY-like chemotaxis protein